jgi:glycerophosphoryl diester phosphodiesterase
MIDVRDIERLRAMRPFLVAHRGGVVTAQSPENSLRAIELAAAHGYAMVELDVLEAADGEPVLIHDGLYINCGVPRPVHTLSSAEITAICYRASDEHVITLAQAIETCAELGLGVMLDKLARDDPAAPDMTPKCLERVASLIEHAGLARATVAIVDSPALRKHLGRVTLFPMRRDDLTGNVPAAGPAGSPEGQFWFGWAAELPDETVARLHDEGTFAIVSINTFHYPQHAPMTLARQDVQRLLAAGTDGFQIDSVYEGCFTART